MYNPLYDLWKVDPEDLRMRDFTVGKFSWAVPNEEAILTLVEYSPLIEVGAGTGYWARLVSEMGGDIIAYDAYPPMEQWHPTRRGGPEKIAEHPDRTIFLCWPPYNDRFAADCLLEYRGRVLVYVGEGRWGCTGDDTFHHALDTLWKHDYTIDIPQWGGMNDYLDVYHCL